MRHKFTVVSVVCLCLALAFSMTLAGERTRDRTVDHSKRSIIDGPATATTGIVDFAQTFDDQVANPANTDPRVTTAIGAQPQRAQGMLSLAITQEGVDAISTLNEILNMDLPPGEETDKILAEVNRLLGDHYDYAPHKQVHFYGQALHYSSDPGQQTWLEEQITSLGGDVFTAAFNQPEQFGTRTFGVQDFCFDALALVLPAFLAPLTIDPGGDHDWYSFDLVLGAGDGRIVTIETLTDMPGTFTDDTDLFLWGGCDPLGFGTDFIAFDDDSGVDFMSLIVSPCLASGTYYIEVGGWIDIGGADNFALSVAETATCVPPTPDEFEPDNDRATATTIGFEMSSGNPGDIMTPVVAQEIQRHNFYPPPDIDFVKFALKRNELVRMRTACEFPTIFNDFTTTCSNFDTDTTLELRWQNEKDYGGLCNQQTAPGSLLIIGPQCGDDLDCDLDGDGLVFPDDDDLQFPVPGFPACLPWALFGNPSFPPFGIDWPLADDDDGGDGFASDLTLCLPRTRFLLAGATHDEDDSSDDSGAGVVVAVPSPSASVAADNDPDWTWYVTIEPFSSADIFEYEIWVRNEMQCLFEVEPNQSFDTATEYNLGEEVHGFYDISETLPFADADLWEFDLDVLAGFDGEAKLVTFETDGYDSFAVDTFIELLVGPDEAGDYFFTGVEDEDGGPGWLSLIEVILPTADDLLGIELSPAQLAACAGDEDSSDDSGPVGPEPDCRLGDVPCEGQVEALLPPRPDEDSDDDSSVAAPLYCGANYFLNVTSNYPNPNFPYTLRTTVEEPPEIETEPNDECGVNAENAEIGQEWLASINPTCDYDAYEFTLGSDTNVSISTLGSGDTTMQLEDAACMRLTCDDDGGPGLLSLIDGCLPAGTYTVRVRAFSGFSAFDYGLLFGGGEACDSNVDPAPVGDGIFRCDDTPAGEFDTCPN